MLLLFIASLLSMYLRFWPQEIYSFLAEELKSLAAAHGERLLHTPHNPISLGKRRDRRAAGFRNSHPLRWTLTVPPPQLCLWTACRQAATRRWLTWAPCSSPGRCRERGKPLVGYDPMGCGSPVMNVLHEESLWKSLYCRRLSGCN